MAYSGLPILTKIYSNSIIRIVRMPVTIIIGLPDFCTKMLYNVLKSDNTDKNVVGLTMRLN